MKQPAIVLFDLDGTLLDSIGGIASCCNKALLQNGYPKHPTVAYRQFVGNGADNLILRALPDEARNADNQRRVRADYDRIYIEACRVGGGELFDGVRELLQWLHEQGVMAGVVSNKPHSQTDTICKAAFAQLLDGWQGQCEGVPLKPDPQALFALAEQLGGRCIAYVGDSDVDIVTGRSAQLPTIGVTWGFQARDRLADAGATMIADTMPQLRNFLLDIISKGE